MMPSGINKSETDVIPFIHFVVLQIMLLKAKSNVFKMFYKITALKYF